MQVFELYIRRLLKRRVLLIMLLLLPLLASFLLVQILKPSYDLEYAVILNSIIGVLICITISNTMLFYSDRQYATDKRILLGVHSKLSFNCQVVAVFLAVSIIQLSVVILFSNLVLGIQLPLTVIEYSIVLLAYTLLNIITVGIGLIAVNSTRSKNSSWVLLIMIALVFAVLGGLLLPSDQLPIIVRDVVAILPTYWVTKVVGILLNGIGEHLYALANYLIGLTVCAAIIMLLLIRTKPE